MYHPVRDIRLAAHGDDFAALGWESESDWYRKVLTEKFGSKAEGKDWAGKE